MTGNGCRFAAEEFGFRVIHSGFGASPLTSGYRAEDWGLTGKDLAPKPKRYFSIRTL